jgi:hypothetical protein
LKLWCFKETTKCSAKSNARIDFQDDGDNKQFFFCRLDCNQRSCDTSLSSNREHVVEQNSPVTLNFVLWQMKTNLW